MGLASKLVLRLLTAAAAVASFLFIPAGSLRFWQAWVYLAIWFVPVSLAFAYFYRHDPELVRRRLQRTETVRKQKIIMKWFYVATPVFYVLPGFDRRFGWSRSPLWLTTLGQAGVLSGWLIMLSVMKANPFAAGTIQVEFGQTVVSSGPYRIVRHPMYLGASLMLLSTPLALGSYWVVPVFVLFIPIIVLRLLNEEEVLKRDLPGYSEYCLHTRFRLVPLLW